MDAMTPYIDEGCDYLYTKDELTCYVGKRRGYMYIEGGGDDSAY